MNEESISEALPVVAEEVRNLHLVAATEANAHQGKRQLTPVVIVSAAAATGAAIWTAITVASMYEIGWIAVGIGVLVELSVRTVGEKELQGCAAVAAVFALLGCVLGNLFSACGFTTLEESGNFWQVLMHFSPTSAIRLMQLSFNSMDILFYGMAAYQTYRLSVREHHRIA